MASSPPSTIGDVDRIIDLYYYESVPAAHPSLKAGGAGSYCYYGPPECVRLAGTELEGWVTGLMEHVAAKQRSGEDFRIQYDGRYWRACRDVSDAGTQVSVRRLPDDCPHLDGLSFEAPVVRDILMGEWLNDGGLILFSGLTGQGKTTTAAATVRSRLEAMGGRAVCVADVNEIAALEGVWDKGSCRQLNVDYQTDDPARRGFIGAIRRAYRSMPATRPGLLLVGEVRDAETASEVLKASSNGMLCITTIHAFDPISALLRLASLAEQQMGDTANLALSQALRVVVHQTLTLAPDVAGWSRGHFSQALLVSDGPQHALANLIRKSAYPHMAAIADTQRIRIEQASRRATPVDHLMRMLGSGGDGMG